MQERFPQHTCYNALLPVFFADCVQMESFPGEYYYISPGNFEVCGFYLIGFHDQRIKVDFLDFDIDCSKGGLLAVSILTYISCCLYKWWQNLCEWYIVQIMHFSIHNVVWKRSQTLSSLSRQVPKLLCPRQEELEHIHMFVYGSEVTLTGSRTRIYTSVTIHVTLDVGGKSFKLISPNIV